MKLKLDAQGHAVIQDGKPVYIHDDGSEVPFDAPAAMVKITELNSESKNHRLEAKAAKEKLSAFEGIEDPAAAMKALQTIKNLDDKKLIDAGEVDKVKKAVSEAYEIKLADANKIIGEKDGHIYKLEVSNRFSSSKYINEKTVLPPDIAEATFGRNFKIENGKVVGYLNGNPIYSKQKPGELADFDEALPTMIDAYPAKDRILKGSGASGSGAQQSTGGGNGKVVKLSDFNNMKPVERSTFMANGGAVEE